ncbi:MAG TPA: phospholipase D-like domain-containing protein [Candidatus Udaeobacter sp.]|nr:phospholipase D-like domain-containing protein [Candidatus Udaeobacter sp.]
MFQQASKDGFSFKIYQGAQMSLLTMDLAEQPAAGAFAGFTLEYTGPSSPRTPVKNLLNFAGTDTITSSVDSPIQAFKWVHFPGSYSQNPVPFGNWDYHATPRFFDASRKLLPLDAAKTVTVTIPVGNFSKAGLEVGFTRAFLKSQAYSSHYGANTKLKPAGDWLFDMAMKAGTKNGRDFTYEQMYVWLGYTARQQIYEILDQALSDNTVEVEMFAYDFNDPGVAQRCLNLAAAGRIRIILDNAALHTTQTGKPATEEDDFETKFKVVAAAGAEIFRCRFARYSHCKIIILKKDGAAFRVLTGSTNFAITGLCVNANHVLLFDRPNIAKYYSDLFNNVWQIGKAAPFRTTNFSTKTKKFTATGFPHSEINFSPHDDARAAEVLDQITAQIQKASTKSVLFAVMEMGDTSTGTLIRALRDLHKNDAIYTYGVTDNSSGDISLYKPGRKNGLLIDASQAKRELPPPFKIEASLPGHAIHHKFVITNFNHSTGRVWCGSSNLALGGEEDNGDNLLCIKDQDVATVFAIEAMRLTDHYNFRSVTEPDIGPPGKTPKKLDNTGAWVTKFFDQDDIRYVERRILA